MEKEYWRDAYTCSSALVTAIENHIVYDIPELVVHVLIDHFISAYYYVPSKCNDISKKLETVFLKNPLLRLAFDNERYRMEWYLNSIQETYGKEPCK